MFLPLKLTLQVTTRTQKDSHLPPPLQIAVCGDVFGVYQMRRMFNLNVPFPTLLPHMLCNTKVLFPHFLSSLSPLLKVPLLAPEIQIEIFPFSVSNAEKCFAWTNVWSHFSTLHLEDWHHKWLDDCVCVCVYNTEINQKNTVHVRTFQSRLERFKQFSSLQRRMSITAYSPRSCWCRILFTINVCPRSQNFLSGDSSSSCFKHHVFEFSKIWNFWRNSFTFDPIMTFIIQNYYE